MMSVEFELPTDTENPISRDIDDEVTSTKDLEENVMMPNQTHLHPREKVQMRSEIW